jgi:hypothetical protein
VGGSVEHVRAQAGAGTTASDAFCGACKTPGRQRNDLRIAMFPNASDGEGRIMQQQKQVRLVGEEGGES